MVHVIRWVTLAFFVLLAGSPEGLASEDAAARKGVFTGDHIGCKAKETLFAYFDAEQSGDRAATGKLIAQRKCIHLKGRTYVPLRLGFVTAYVQVYYQGTDIKLWTRSAAVVESPPPARDTHFNF